jgi:excinuclease UvrABC nuclease subunit
MTDYPTVTNALNYGPKGPGWVYSHLDAEGRILYIGVTAYPETREKTHKRNSPWYADVTETQYEGPYPLEAAGRREVELISQIEPPNNIADTSRAKRVRTAPVTVVDRIDAPRGDSA